MNKVARRILNSQPYLYIYIYFFVLLYMCVVPPRGARSAEGPQVFLDRTVYFCLSEAGSDVTNVSSSSWHGSNLAPEILLSLSCCDVSLVRGGEKGWGGGLSHLSPLNTMLLL